MTRHWYPFFVGDYNQKTSHLSLLEHGAYRLLIDHYMATCCPLPNDPAKLLRICRARTPSERKAVLSTVAEFFIKDGTLLRNKKCDSEIDKQLIYSKAQSAKASARHCRGYAGAYAGDMPTCATTTTTTTTTKKDTPLTPKGEKCADGQMALIEMPDPPPPAEKEEEPNRFDEFYEAYPKKRDRARALVKYTIAIRSTDQQTIIDGARRYAEEKSLDERPDVEQFTKNAATWLHGKCWEDYEGRDYSEPDISSLSEDERVAIKLRQAGLS